MHVKKSACHLREDGQKSRAKSHRLADKDLLQISALAQLENYAKLLWIETNTDQTNDVEVGDCRQHGMRYVELQKARHLKTRCVDLTHVPPTS